MGLFSNWVGFSTKQNSILCKKEKKGKACLALPKQSRFYLDLREMDGGKEAFRQVP
jgi:hypothetical protein